MHQKYRNTSPWIGSLTQKDKNTIASKQWLTSDIIEEVHSILSKQFTLISGFQTPCNAPAYNTTLKKWVSNNSFTEQQGPAVQIHHTENHLWVTSILTHTNELFLLDSMYDKLTTSLEIQLFQVYSNSKKRLLVKIPEVQKQTNKIDCGLYAIVNAVEFCFTSFSGGLHIEFNQQLMRDHLISCLEKGQFSVFPPKVKMYGQVQEQCG